MSRVAWLKVLIGIGCYAGGVLCAFASSQTALENELAAIAEREYVGPRAALHTLAKIQAMHAEMSTKDQALVYEMMSKAKFHTNEFPSSVQFGRLLEELGKQKKDKSAECLGVLSQVYGNWKMGNFRAAYDLARRAERFSPTLIDAKIRVKLLVTTASLESEKHQSQAALRIAGEAVQLANASNDDALLYMATYAQTAVFLAANNINLAVTSVDRLLAVGVRSPYRERLVRAKGMEFAVASAAGLTSRARQAITERIRLIQELHLDEVLGGALVDFADLQLKSGRYSEAAALSEQALNLETVFVDIPLANTAHLNHAIAKIHLGQVRAGKAEVEELLKSNTERAQLLAYLPEYIAALTQAGDVDASVQAAALRKKLEIEESLRRAKDGEMGRSDHDLRARENQLNVLEAADAHRQSNVWLLVAGSSVTGLISLLILYGRLRSGNRILAEANRQLYTSSNRDTLTGLFNRRYVEGYLVKLSRHSTDANLPVLSGCGLVLLMDIDHFKQVNDTYGHAVGDQVLKATAERLSALFRNEDIVVRWGGEEFLALLPKTHASEASSIAARVLDAVSATPVVVNSISLNVTISVGICRLSLGLKERDLNWDEVVHMADQALYFAKQNGRDMAYGITAAVNATTAEMAQGLRTNWEQEKVELFKVLGARRQKNL